MATQVQVFHNPSAWARALVVLHRGLSASQAYSCLQPWEEIELQKPSVVKAFLHLLLFLKKFSGFTYIFLFTSRVYIMNWQNVVRMIVFRHKMIKIIIPVACKYFERKGLYKTKYLLLAIAFLLPQQEFCFLLLFEMKSLSLYKLQTQFVPSLLEALIPTCSSTVAALSL